jgi:hypothetical protein
MIMITTRTGIHLDVALLTLADGTFSRSVTTNELSRAQAYSNMLLKAIPNYHSRVSLIRLRVPLA